MADCLVLIWSDVVVERVFCSISLSCAGCKQFSRERHLPLPPSNTEHCLARPAIFRLQCFPVHVRCQRSNAVLSLPLRHEPSQIAL